METNPTHMSNPTYCKEHILSSGFLCSASGSLFPNLVLPSPPSTSTDSRPCTSRLASKIGRSSLHCSDRLCRSREKHVIILSKPLKGELREHDAILGVVGRDDPEAGGPGDGRRHPEAAGPGLRFDVSRVRRESSELLSLSLCLPLIFSESISRSTLHI